MKNHQNEPQYLPSYIKKSLEKNGFAQVFMIRQNILDNNNKKDDTKKYNFQGQSEISNPE